MDNQYRQGDLLFVQVGELPARAKKLDHKIVAEGEATGHQHAAVGDAVTLYEDGNVMFLEAVGDASVRHQEHHETKLPAGIYRVVRQREYTPSRIVNVQD